MNILLLSHRIPFPANKGEKIRTYHQLRFLVERGHRISVLSPIETHEDHDYGDQLIQQLGIDVRLFPLGPKWPRMAWGLLSGQPLSVTHFYSRSLQRAFDEALASQQFDAVICTSSAMAFYVLHSDSLNAKHRSDRPRLILDFMDLDSDKWRQYQARSSQPMAWVYGREARLLSRLELRCYDVFDECFFISDNEVALFSTLLADTGKVSVLGNGLDTQVFYPGPEREDPGHPVFLFTGVMDYKPNVDAVCWFAEALWESIRSRWPDAEFVIAGMAPAPEVRQLERKPGVTVTGFVDDILPWYHRADIFVAPFRLARGVQNKILQALACGLPVVTTSLGLEGISATPGRDIVVADDEHGLLAGIAQILDSPETRRRMADRGPEIIRLDYSWESRLQGLARALETADLRSGV
ncbi:TIGR03087 family PEP-CTERM/XrtA system glycosyltransferase [Marinobacter oulmenensis]|uniref:Sugar transferase (PEP-CTERM/EpsH1 system associated) n=1 Tax=Marinobacter oulmenensis TaxID=643747 RepID=A0A840UIQ7_9GAMM|nr:sugar transferase (PEP-CTERM/EpsH1 system associated) [Marinobacter oulmenensis]